MTDVYQLMKRKSYSLATSVSGANDGDAKAQGFKDVFDLIMSDPQHPRQAAFQTQLSEVLDAMHTEVLLDGMAREYAEAADWAAYIGQKI